MLVQASAFGSWLHHLPHVLCSFYVFIFWLPVSILWSGVSNKSDLIWLDFGSTAIGRRTTVERHWVEVDSKASKVWL